MAYRRVSKPCTPPARESGDCYKLSSPVGVRSGAMATDTFCSQSLVLLHKMKFAYFLAPSPSGYACVYRVESKAECCSLYLGQSSAKRQSRYAFQTYFWTSTFVKPFRSMETSAFRLTAKGSAKLLHFLEP